MSGLSGGFWEAVRTVARNPGLLIPHLKKRTLLDIPLPLGSSLPTKPRIRALVLDKDNTLCPPGTTFVHPDYREFIDVLRASSEFSHHPQSILIVSNSAGKTQSFKHETEAQTLEAQLSLPVIRHWKMKSAFSKPKLGLDVARHLLDAGVVSSSQEIAVVGDKLVKDVMMARLMGSWAVFLEDGWRDPADPKRSYHEAGTRLERFAYQITKGVLWNDDDVPLRPGQKVDPK